MPLNTLTVLIKRIAVCFTDTPSPLSAFCRSAALEKNLTRENVSAFETPGCCRIRCIRQYEFNNNNITVAIGKVILLKILTVQYNIPRYTFYTFPTPSRPLFDGVVNLSRNYCAVKCVLSMRHPTAPFQRKYKNRFANVNWYANIFISFTNTFCENNKKLN